VRKHFDFSSSRERQHIGNEIEVRFLCFLLVLFVLANWDKLDQERVPIQSGVEPHDDTLKGKIVTLAGHFRTLFDECVQKSRAGGDSQRGVSFHLDVVPATLDNLKGIHLLGEIFGSARHPGESVVDARVAAV
jgi:hypothetical protein